MNTDVDVTTDSTWLAEDAPGDDVSVVLVDVSVVCIVSIDCDVGVTVVTEVLGGGGLVLVVSVVSGCAEDVSAVVVAAEPPVLSVTLWRLCIATARSILVAKTDEIMERAKSSVMARERMLMVDSSARRDRWKWLG